MIRAGSGIWQWRHGLVFILVGLIFAGAAMARPARPGGASATSRRPRANVITKTSTLGFTSSVKAGSAAKLKGITAIGDSVMLDYAQALARDLPGIDIRAAVSRQWSEGISEVATLRAQGDLGSTVIVALGTNGPVTFSQFKEMMSALTGVSHVIFVSVFVDRPWQNQVNAVLRWGVTHFRKARLVNWAVLAASHRNWLYSDGTHLPIGGQGAVALAALIARTVRSLGRASRITVHRE